MEQVGPRDSLDSQLPAACSAQRRPSLSAALLVETQAALYDTGFKTQGREFLEEEWVTVSLCHTGR